MLVMLEILKINFKAMIFEDMELIIEMHSSGKKGTVGASGSSAPHTLARWCWLCCWCLRSTVQSIVLYLQVNLVVPPVLADLALPLCPG